MMVLFAIFAANTFFHNIKHSQSPLYLQDVVVMVDRATNRSRGFGFVTFETEEAVEAVMRNKCEMMGKWVEVKRAEPRDSRFEL